MKTNKIKNWILAGATTLIVATSCDVDPSFYSQVVPETFYTSQDAVGNALTDLSPLEMVGRSR